MPINDFEIAIAWHGLPFYAARLIRRGIHRLGKKVTVIGTRPSVPIRGMEEALDQPVNWIDPDSNATWRALGLPVPRLFLETGWAIPAFNRLSSQVKATGGKVVALVDNSLRRDIRQAVGSVVYRLAYSRRFDAVMVPGESGRALATKFGVPSDRIFQGMYGADPEVFFASKNASPRLNEFIFAGQFIKRKGVDLLVRAFARVKVAHPEYSLRMIGGGPLKDGFADPGVIVEDFLQPRELAERYRRARFFILPSRDEHWGLVVHEAALCGNVLLLSNHVGAAVDLLDDRNGFGFRANDIDAIERAMEKAILLGPAEYASMSRESVDKAAAFGPDRWAESFLSIVEYLIPAGEFYGPKGLQSQGKIR